MNDDEGFGTTVLGSSEPMDDDGGESSEPSDDISEMQEATDQELWYAEMAAKQRGDEQAARRYRIARETEEYQQEAKIRDLPASSEPSASYHWKFALTVIILLLRAIAVLYGAAIVIQWVVSLV